MSSGSTQFAIEPSPEDAISAVKFSPNPGSTKLALSAWDKHVYLYEVRPTTGESTREIMKFEHRAPVLDVCFGGTDEVLYSAGLDWDVRKLDATSGLQQVLSTHEQGVKSVAHSKEHALVISAAWDSTLHIHPSDGSSWSPVTVSLPEKPFALSVSTTKLVVAMASRVIHIYDLEKLAKQCSAGTGGKMDIEPWQRRESSLKFMTRTVACMPNDEGYASSSIDGRAAVEWFDDSADSQARKYAFKCHRQAEDGVDVVYPVNALAFHPRYGTFASGGGDGVVCIWDGLAKRRIRSYPQYASSIAALSFSSDGKYLAVAISPGFEQGKDEIAEGTVKVFIRQPGENELKRKAAK